MSSFDKGFDTLAAMLRPLADKRDESVAALSVSTALTTVSLNRRSTAMPATACGHQSRNLASLHRAGAAYDNNDEKCPSQEA